MSQVGGRRCHPVVGAGIVGLLGAGLVAAPAVAGASHGHGGAITKHRAAAQYLADDAPFATARTTYESAFTAWFNAHEAASVTTSFVAPFVTACRTFQHELQTQRWPAADKSDVRAFAASLGVIATDVAGLPSVTLSSGPAWAAKLKKDSTASIALAQKLRKKLGLSATAS